MITLTRFACLADRTLGRLDYEDKSWWTVELPYKDNEPFVSCIPEDLYKLGRFSVIHGRKTTKNTAGFDGWEVMDVTGRTVILIHVANKPADVLGCIGLGQGVYPDLKGVSSSALAIQDFYETTKDLDTMDLRVMRGEILQ